MRFVRFGERGRERPGILADGDVILDISGLVHDLDARFWGEGGADMIARELASGTLARAARHAGPSPEPVT